MAPREPTTEDEQWLRKVRLGPAEAPFREAWLGDERLNWLSASSLEALLVQGDQDVLDTLKAKVEPLAVRGLIAKLTGSAGPSSPSGGDVTTRAAAGAGPSQESPAADEAQQRSRGNHMLPLEEDGKTIGTACCIGERNLLTARHNIAGPAGRSIVMTGFTAGGRPVRHVVSFPRHGISLLQLADGELPDGVTAFMLAAGVGLVQHMKVTLLSYPLAPGASVPKESALVSHGRVKWISPTATLAAVDYQGTVHTSSGGAVALNPHVLAGIYLGGLGHEGGQPRDSPDAQARDQHPRYSRSPAPAAAEGSTVGSSSFIPGTPLETGVWSMPPPSSRLSERGLKSGHNAEQGGDVGTDSLGYFVPAHTLYALLADPEVQRLMRGSQPRGQSGAT